MNRFKSFAAFVGFVALFSSAAPAQTVPDISGTYYHELDNARNPTPAGGWEPGMYGFGPIKFLPDFPSNDQGPHHGDYNSPLLQPWVADIVRRNNDAEAAGKPIPQTNSLCQPDGVVKLLSRVGPFQIIQTPTEVIFLYQRNHQRRIVHLNAKHPENLKPSWYGHSIGRYEGDTLVIDTIGHNDKTQIDRYGVPHTTRLHVVERWKLIDGGKAIEVRATVEDPGAFTKPWSGVSTSRRQDERWEEYVCVDDKVRVSH